MPRTQTKPADVIQLYRLSHHCIAQYFAMGMEKWEIQRKTGFTVRRLSLLESDPTFQQLIAYYAQMAEADRQAVIDEYHDIQELNALVAARMLSEKLDDSLESGVLPSYAQLLAITAANDKRRAASTPLNVNVNIGLALDAAKERAGRAKEVTIIDNLPSLPPPRPRLTDTGLRPEVNNRKPVTKPNMEATLKKLRI
jgi:hypothetical protein